MDEILDEGISDQHVIKVLLKIIRDLKRGHMSKLLFDKDGTLYLAHFYEEVEIDSLDNQVSALQDEILGVEAIKAAADRFKTTIADVAPVAPLTDVVEDAPVAPAVEQPVAPVETPVAEPAVENVPVVEVVTPATPETAQPIVLQ